MSSLSDLPDELLKEIVDILHATSPATLADVTIASKRLHRLVHALQWKHVALPWRLNRNSPIARFINTQCGNSDIRSITLQPQRSVLNAFRVRMEHAFDHLHTLCNCLASLSNLTTFSIYLDDQVDSRCYLPGSVLARIVRALPPSVVHLELDTEGVDRGWEHDPAENPAQHLCLAINERMSSLESLRLRLSSLCTDLFQLPGPSNLRRAFLRTDISPGRESHLGLPAKVSDCKTKDASRHPGREASRYIHTDYALTTKGLFNHLLELQASGTFPHLERFIIYSWNTELKSDAYVYLHDVATRSVTQYPTRWTGNYENSLDPLYEISSENNTVFRGGRKDLEAAMLHEVSWIEMPTGTRLPPDVRMKDEEPRLVTAKLQPTAKRNQEQTSQASGVLDRRVIANYH